MPNYNSLHIQRLVEMDGVLYAGGNRQPSVLLLSSQNNGQLWQFVMTPPDTVISQMAAAPALPMSLCDPTQPLVCYRIDGRPQVEQSQDGGKTWSVAWQIPAEREDFIIRSASIDWPRGNCFKTPDFKTFDMLFLREGNASTLVVALGNEGLVYHRGTAGVWQRTALEFAKNSTQTGFIAEPTPYAARNLEEAIWTTLPEWPAALLAGSLAYLGLCAWAWFNAARHRWTGAIRQPAWMLRPLWVPAIWILLLLLDLGFYNLFLSIWVRNTQTISYSIYVAVTLITGAVAVSGLGLPLAIFVASLFVWRRAGELAAHPGIFRRQCWQALLAWAIIVGASGTVFLLWAYGIIMDYKAALLLAGMAGLAGLVYSVVRLRQGMNRAFS